VRRLHGSRRCIAPPGKLREWIRARPACP
jgi:hypothetical protein